MKRVGSYSNLMGGGADIFLENCKAAHLHSSSSASLLSLDRSNVTSIEGNDANVGQEIDNAVETADEESTKLVENIMEKGFAVALRKPYYGSLPNTPPGSSPTKRKVFAYPAREELNTIRFQVLVWYIGPIDVVQGNVAAQVRITLFWNAAGSHVETHDRRSVKSFVMQGRKSALERTTTEDVDTAIDVPPVSILNAVSFNVIGSPDISELSRTKRLYRWSCLYKVSLLQDEESMKVDNFPHDEHNLTIRLGILSARERGGKWDSRKWKLALATEADTKGTIRVPQGMIVDHVKIPEFSFDKDTGLDFSFTPLKHGTGKDDECLRVSLKVRRESSYYDKNIVPILVALHLVAVSLFTMDAKDFFKRGLMLLNITFVEIGLRTSLDRHLPSVGYEIKLQRIMNAFFVSLLVCVIESSACYFLINRRGWSVETTDTIDFVVALLVLSFGCYQCYLYYKDRKDVHQKPTIRS